MRPAQILRCILFLVPLALAGCATEKGAILTDDPGYYDDASFVEVPDDEYFWLAPVRGGEHGTEPVQVQVPKGGLWLKAGWMNVESQCYAPKKAVHQDYPVFGQFLDTVPFYVKPGLHYLLRCNDYRVGSFDFIVEGQLHPP